MVWQDERSHHGSFVENGDGSFEVLAMKDDGTHRGGGQGNGESSDGSGKLSSARAHDVRAD
jgi:hypothetical protein